MRPSRSLLASFVVVSIMALVSPALAGPPPPTTQIFRAYPPPAVDLVLAIGDFAADPGLELLGADATAGSMLVVSLSTGNVIGDFSLLEQPRDWRPTNPHEPDYTVHILVRDVDRDGYGELLFYQSNLGQTSMMLGLYGFSGGSTLGELWYVNQGDLPQGFDLRSALFDVADMTVETVDQLVVRSNYLYVFSGETGALLYSSEMDHPLRTPTSFTVADYDGDFRDEILATMVCLNPCTDPDEVWLIDGTYSGGGGGGGGGGTDAPPGATGISLRASYPNPSSGRTSIAFYTPQAGRVRLRIFDAAGRRVKTLLDSSLNAGEHLEIWDGRDSRGVSVVSGIYFYELDVEGRQVSRKMLQIR